MNRWAGPLMTLVIAVAAVPACIPVNPRSPEDYVGQLPESSRPSNIPDKGPIDISIGDAVLIGLENNPSLNIERLNPAVRRTTEEQARAAFDPVLNYELSGDRNRTQGGKSSSMTDALAVSEFLPTGTNVGASFASGRMWQADDEYSSRAGMTVTQSLLRGFGLDVNLANLRQARLDTKISQYQLRGFAESFVADVESTYWDLALAKRSIKIFEDSLEVAKRQLDETKQRIDVGVLAGTELAAAEAEVARRRVALIAARSTAETTRLTLLQLMSPRVPEVWTRDVQLKDEPVITQVKLDNVENHVKVGLKMRPDLNEARIRVQRNELELVKTKNGLLPKLDLFITMGKTGYADSFGSGIQNMGYYYDMAGGMALQYEIGNRSAQAADQRAMLQKDQIEQSVLNFEHLVQVDVRSAYITVQRTREEVQATEAARRFAEETVRAETEKFRIGRSTSILVAQAQRDLLQAQIAELQAQVNLLKSLTALYRLEGSLLERRGIVAPGRSGDEGLLPQNPGGK